MVSIESKSSADQRLNKQPVPGKLFKLEQENELRFEVEGSEKVIRQIEGNPVTFNSDKHFIAGCSHTEEWTC